MDRFDGWPGGLWVPATRAGDGEVVVFGKDRLDVPVHVAVEASSAVPGMFRPRMIDGVAYIDGGVTTSTHAHLLVDAAVDRVFISAPMSRPSRRLFATNARQRLIVEVAALRAAGIETIVVQPSAAAVEAARGFPRRNPGAAPDIVRHAVAATRFALSSA
jgi:NTE family protein